MDISNVRTVEQTRKKQKEAERKAQAAEEQVKLEMKSVAGKIKRIKKQAEKEVQVVKEKVLFWRTCFWILLCLLIVTNIRSML